MKKIYYLYTHTRLDNNEIFYVGVGHTYKDGIYNRAHTKSKRNVFWKNVVSKTDYSIQIIKKFYTKEECNNAEIELISTLGRKIFKKGTLVNIAPGGNHWKDPIKVYQYCLKGHFIKEWSCAKEIESVLGICYTSIYRCCKDKGRCEDYQFRHDKKKKIEEYENKQYKKVHQFDKTGKYIASYSNIVNASKITKISSTQIGACALGHLHATKDYIWSYNKCECIVKRLILQKDENGNTVNTFYSLPHVKKALNLKSHNSIDNALKGVIQKKAYGFFWEELKNVKINACDD
jgi:hypothetical protein